VSILAPDFDEKVAVLPVHEAAAEQVQALRYQLEERLTPEERPVHRQLSAELERVVEEFAGNREDVSRKLGPPMELRRRGAAHLGAGVAALRAAVETRRRASERRPSA